MLSNRYKVKKMSRSKKSGFHPKKATQKTITEYCHNSTVAGLSYISDSTSYTLDRLLWLLAVFVFAAMAIYWSYQAYHEWQDEPVITTVKTTGNAYCKKGPLNFLLSFK